MEKFLTIILNPYCYLVLSALVIIGLTQIIKLIPFFKNNNWNISFPVLFGYIAAFSWALALNMDIELNMQTLVLYGAGIGTMSTTLYTILKKIFSKNYQMDEKIKASELYTFLSNLLTTDVTGFKEKTTIEKYSYIISIASNLTSVIDKLQKGDKASAKTEINTILSKFVNINNLGEGVENLLNILKKEYNIPEIKEVKKQTLTKPE